MGQARAIAVTTTLWWCLTQLFGWLAWHSFTTDPNNTLTSATRALIVFLIFGAVITVGLWAYRAVAIPGAHPCHGAYYDMNRILWSTDIPDAPRQGAVAPVDAAGGAAAGGAAAGELTSLDAALIVYQILHAQSAVHVFSTAPIVIIAFVLLLASGGQPHHALMITALTFALSSVALGVIVSMGLGEGSALSSALVEIIGGARSLELSGAAGGGGTVTHDPTIIAHFHRVGAFPSAEKLDQLHGALGRAADVHLQLFLNRHRASPQVCYYIAVALRHLHLAAVYTAPAPAGAPRFVVAAPADPALSGGGGVRVQSPFGGGHGMLAPAANGDGGAGANGYARPASPVRGGVHRIGEAPNPPTPLVADRNVAPVPFTPNIEGAASRSLYAQSQQPQAMGAHEPSWYARNRPPPTPEGHPSSQLPPEFRGAGGPVPTIALMPNALQFDGGAFPPPPAHGADPSVEVVVVSPVDASASNLSARSLALRPPPYGPPPAGLAPAAASPLRIPGGPAEADPA